MGRRTSAMINVTVNLRLPICTCVCWVPFELDWSLEANISAETVWATISLKDQRKLVVGSYYRPPDSGSDSIDDLESVLSFITEKFRNNPQCTIILGGDFNAGDIDWESHTVCEHSLNRQINEKILSVISSSGLVQIQKDFTRNDKILDLLCTNKPDLFSDIRSIPGVSDQKSLGTGKGM